MNALLQRSEEHTSELKSRPHLVCRLLLEKRTSDSRRSKRSWVKIWPELERRPPKASSRITLRRKAGSSCCRKLLIIFFLRKTPPPKNSFFPTPARPPP